MTEECEGEVTVTDPRHPLFGRTLKLAGLAYLPGHVRHCQVEISPGQVGYVPIASTHLSRGPVRTPSVLSVTAVEQLVAAFQAVCPPTLARRHRHERRDHGKPVHARGERARLGTTARKRARRVDRSHRPDPHGGGGA